MGNHDDSLGPSPAQLGDTISVAPGVWTPLDDHGTEIYVYGDQPVDIAFQTAAVDDEVRQLRSAFDEIDRLLDQYRGQKALREGVQAVVDRVRGANRPNSFQAHIDRDHAALGGHDDPASVRMQHLALDRMHAGLGLPCDRCDGPCQIDGSTAPKPVEHEHDGHCLKAGGACSPEAQGWAEGGAERG